MTLLVEPRVERKTCERCDDQVLTVPLRASELIVVVQAVEVTPYQRCPVCRSGYHRKPGVTQGQDSYFTRDLPCWRCGAPAGAEGYIGERFQGGGVALGEDDRARPVWLEGVVSLADGEAVHRVHHCSIQ